MTTRTTTGRTIRLVVFDFDQTLCRCHTCRDKRLDLCDALTTFFHPRTADMLLALRRQGYDVAIASFGRKDVIMDLLHRLLRQHIQYVFTPANVITPRTLGGTDGAQSTRWSKSKMLKHLAQLYGIRSPQQILLFDDQWANVQDALQHGYGKKGWSRKHKAVKKSQCKNDFCRIIVTYAQKDRLMHNKSDLCRKEWLLPSSEAAILILKNNQKMQKHISDKYYETALRRLKKFRATSFNVFFLLVFFLCAHHTNMSSSWLRFKVGGTHTVKDVLAQLEWLLCTSKDTQRSCACALTLAKAGFAEHVFAWLINFTSTHVGVADPLAPVLMRGFANKWQRVLRLANVKHKESFFNLDANTALCEAVTYLVHAKKDSTLHHVMACDARELLCNGKASTTYKNGEDIRNKLEQLWSSSDAPSHEEEIMVLWLVCQLYLRVSTKAERTRLLKAKASPPNYEADWEDVKAYKHVLFWDDCKRACKSLMFGAYAEGTIRNLHMTFLQSHNANALLYMLHAALLLYRLALKTLPRMEAPKTLWRLTEIQVQQYLNQSENNFSNAMALTVTTKTTSLLPPHETTYYHKLLSSHAKVKPMSRLKRRKVLLNHEWIVL